ncbi:MAG: NAD-dependent epimerase/dehydratase family protein, partial [bacterium]|nr:NAD-dependent epimerase/dehydratase family protein [bacterium]
MGEDINRLVTTSSKKIPTALVAGGAGFVGSGLCEALLNKECRVVCVDNLSAGKKENLKGCFDNPRFVFLDHDVNHQFLSDFPRVDYIFHLAGIEEYLNEKDQNIETLSVNSIGTKNLLDLANKFGAKFLLASSVDVYRGAISTMFLENYFGLSERDTRRYGHHEAKRFAEALVSEYYRKKNLDCRICRLANIYGPRMDLFSETEIASLVCAAVKKEPLRIFGEGLKVLHPTFVNDAIEGLIKAMVSEESRGKIYHLINPSSVTVLNLAYLLQKIVPEAKVFFSPEKEELKFPPQKIDMAPTYEELGWNPKTDLLDGLKKTIDDSMDKLVPKEVVASDTKDKLFVIGSQGPTIPELSFWQKALFWVASFSFPRPKINLSFGERAATIIPLTLLLASFLILLPVSFFSWRVKKAVFHLNQARE